jgi:hypothetical protein
MVLNTQRTISSFTITISDKLYQEVVHQMEKVVLLKLREVVLEKRVLYIANLIKIYMSHLRRAVNKLFALLSQQNKVPNILEMLILQ